ncbi:MAG: lycopene cyclase family protein [Oscillochloridaceae bacterium umkhey_bin13]
MPSYDYDYIIAGGGAAGLSLAYHLGLVGLNDQRVLLVDQIAKTSNDRTWCFWEIGDGPFEPIVTRSWDKLWLHGHEHSARESIAPYRYKMIEGSAFYRFMDDWLAEQPQFERRLGKVERFDDHGDAVTAWVDGQPVRARWVFSSIYQPGPRDPNYAYWLQHFKGWVITAPRPIFDPEAATFMDFRVAQADDVRFMYVLPYDAHTALVEYTIFSADLVDHAVYEAGLRTYIHGLLGLESYAIQHVEYGVIPMTDTPFVRHPSPRVLRIGTAGGLTKASTGFTFQRIQRDSAQIATSLRDHGRPLVYIPSARHALMDGVLLNVLEHNRESGSLFFERLFRNNRPQQVLRFLDEDTSLIEDMALMGTVNLPAFMVASADVVVRRMRAASTRRRLTEATSSS